LPRHSSQRNQLKAVGKIQDRKNYHQFEHASLEIHKHNGNQVSATLFSHQIVNALFEARHSWVHLGEILPAQVERYLVKTLFLLVLSLLELHEFPYKQDKVALLLKVSQKRSVLLHVIDTTGLDSGLEPKPTPIHREIQSPEQHEQVGDQEEDCQSKVGFY
jgi:hypothetical protein